MYILIMVVLLLLFAHLLSFFVLLTEGLQAKAGTHDALVFILHHIVHHIMPLILVMCRVLFRNFIIQEIVNLVTIVF